MIIAKAINNAKEDGIETEIDIHNEGNVQLGMECIMLITAMIEAVTETAPSIGRIVAKYVTEGGMKKRNEEKEKLA